MLLDLTVAIRALAKRPGYVMAVLLTLGLGIGATTVMFSLVDAALLRPLPFSRPDRLVLLTGVFGADRSPRGASFPEIGDWRQMNATLQEVSFYDEISLNLRHGGEAVRVESEMVASSYFSLLGVQAARGGTFLPADDLDPDGRHAVIVSDRFWRERLAADPAVIGRAITLNDRPLEIVGVMPPGFAGLSFDTDVWIPPMMSLLSGSSTVLQDRNNRWLIALARLKDGVNVARAQDDLTRVAALLEQQHPLSNRQRSVSVVELQRAMLGDRREPVRVLFGVVLLFLAIACANAAALQLVRASSRRRELALRAALGARRWHLLRQLLVESLVLSCSAGVMGALGAVWATGIAVAWLPEGALPAYVQPTVDPRALAFTSAISILIGILVALLTGFTATRASAADALKQGGRAVESGLRGIRRLSTQQVLVGAEIAAAMVLLIVAGLLVRSLARQSEVQLGLDPHGVTVASVSLPPVRYAVDQRTAFVERLEAGLRALPGVQSVGIGSDVPLAGGSNAGMMLPDVSTQPDQALRYFRHFATPDYFAALGIPIVAGRPFTPRDRRGAPPVAIINDAAARRIWGGADPIGRRIRMGRTTEGAQVEIVGIAGSARFRDLTTDLTAAVEPDVYFPYAQVTSGDLTIAVRTAAGSPVPAAALSEAVAQIDAGLPVYQVRALSDVASRLTSGARFVSALLTMFSAAALLLASVGLYGLIAYVVGLCRQEIAIRLALGANRRRLTVLIVRNGMAVVLLGVFAGGAAAMVAGRALRAQLFRTSSADPVVLTTVACLLVAAGLVAILLPTRAALRVNPQAALRGE